VNYKVVKAKNKYLWRAVLAGLISLPVISSAAWAATTQSSSSGSPTTPPDPEQSTTLQQRIAQRKTAFKISLTAVQSQNIAKKCSAAQTALKTIQAKDKTKEFNRTQAYTDLATKLNTVVGRLDSQKVDTTNLKLEQTKFNSAINQYLADAATYKTALDDIVALNCIADPTGFQTALVEARQFRTKLSSDVQQIKSVNATLIKALGDLKNTLSKNAAKDGAVQ
jgi:hypothetical protein